MTTTRYVISQPLLAALAGFLPDEKSTLSPLHIDNPPQLTPEQKLQLETAEILIDGSVLSDPARQMLTTLSKIAAFARARLNAPAGAFDQTIHFSPDGTESVFTANKDEELTLTSPADAEAALAELGALLGPSKRSLTPWSVRLPPLEMQALAAMLDLRRRAVLRSLADQQPVMAPPSDPAAITAAIQTMSGTPLWLTAAVQTAASQLAAPTVTQVQTSLIALVDLKLAGQHSGNFYPSHEAIQVVDRFLLLNTFLSLEVGSCNSQGRSTSARQAWLGAGMGELLHLTTEKDLLLLELATPTAALEQIRTYFTHFDALPAPALEVVPLALLIQNGSSAGKVVDLGDETVMGRSEQADIHLLDSRTSRRHSVVRRLDEGFMLNDAGSTNGTFLNNHPVTTPTALTEGDMILIGETQLKVVRAGFVPPQLQAESTPTVFVGEAIRLNEETPPMPAAPPVPPVPPPVPAPPPADGVIRLTPAPPEVLPQAHKNPPAPGVVKLEPLAPPPMREAPPADGNVRLTPAAPLPTPPPVKTPPADGVVKLEPPAQTPAAAPVPSGPHAPETPETPPRWFVPPPPPVKPAPVIPPPPNLTPAPFEAPPSGPPERPANAKLAQCARCREPLGPNDLVCSHCGQPVGQPVVSTTPVLPQTMAVCPKCFSPIEYGARFCGTCGHKLT